MGLLMFRRRSVIGGGGGGGGGPIDTSNYLLLVEGPRLILVEGTFLIIP